MDSKQDAIIVAITVVLIVLGAVALIYGLVQVVRARRLERGCTSTAPGRVVELIDHASGRISAYKRVAREEKVEAANEAIAAKKRAYQAKQRERARQRADEPLATWSVIVSWEPSGAGAGRRLEGTRRHRQTRFKVGQTLHVRYDPADPGVAYLQEEGTPKSFGLTMLACGAALIVLGVICWFLLPGIAAQY